MATLDQLIEQMVSADLPPLPPGHPVFDGNIHRFGPKRKAWYVLREYAARNGRRYIVGAFGIWQGSENNAIPVKADFTGIEPDEYQRLQRAQVAEEQKRRAKRELRSGNAANRAKQQWQAARARLSAGEEVPYLRKKRLQWENGLRVFSDGTLLIPMVRYDVTEEQQADPDGNARRLVGLQKIRPDGFKLFNKGMDPIGAAFRFGPKKPKDGELILVGEGWATVASVHQGLERAYAAFCAFNTGNLLPVARILRQLYPKSPLLFLADDDAYLEAYINKRLRDDYGVRDLYRVEDAEKTFKGKDGPVTVHAHIHDDLKAPVITAGIRTLVPDTSAPEGTREKLRTIIIACPGRSKAWDAAGAVGNAWVVWPKFRDRKLRPDAGLEASDDLPAGPGRLTDFNDLHVAEGMERVVAQVGDAIKQIEEAYELAQALQAGAPAAGEGASGGGGKGGDDEPDWQLHGSLIRRFTQIYPSDTAYDQDKGRIVKIEHMRLRFGTKAVSMWLSSPRKRVIDPEQIVFDPSCRADPKTTVNLFRGLPEQIGGVGSCNLLLELIHYLCGENPEDTDTPVTQWVLRWMAYPLQHLGAKMQTAVVMHGEEGTGKNLVWGALRKIYGRHGGVITQRQLEDKFNTWQSAKLFVVANEVVTRQEMSHQGGYIRNLITEPEVQINPKFLDQREEANHMNIVFLANAIQPMLLGPNDRRCMVIRTPNPRDAEFYKAVGAEVAAGGVAAFHKYLMELDLGDFSEHTKPPLTEAKRALIEVSLPTPQLFWMELKDGLLGLPYVPALATDLYKAYCVFCARNGYKMPEGMKFFSPNFMAMNGVRRVDRFVPEPGRQVELAMVGTEQESRLRKRRVFLMGKPDMDADAEKARIVRGVAEFRSCLREYLREEAAYGGQAGQGQGDSERAF